MVVMTLASLVAVDEAEETGWKFVHADVFRFPAHPNLFSAAIGSGTQILVMTFVIFGLALVRASSSFPLAWCQWWAHWAADVAQLAAPLPNAFACCQVGVYYPYNRGALLASCVFLYAITAGALCMIRHLVLVADSQPLALRCRSRYKPA